MEVHHAGVRLPPLDNLAYAGVIKRRPPTKPASQTLLRAAIVAGKHVQPAETSKQHVLGRPSADPSQLAQPRADLIVVVACEALEVERAAIDSVSQCQQRTDLLPAEANLPVGGHRHSCNI